jgi:hypothetical protein
MTFFIFSGAQQILSNPEFQSEKFLKVFTEIEPLPRVFENASILYIGIYLISTLSLIVFIFLNDKLNGGWLKKGLTFGVINWLLMIPWFEFYLPYNVMHEPLKLVLLEGLLWLCTLICVGLIYSFIYNFKNQPE